MADSIKNIGRVMNSDLKFTRNFTLGFGIFAFVFCTHLSSERYPVGIIKLAEN